MIDINKLYGLIDWVSLTFNCSDYNQSFRVIEKLVQHLNLSTDDFIGAKSNKGYMHALNYQDFLSIHFDSYDEDHEHLDKGIHLNISGQGCRFLETHISNFSWQVFFKAMVNIGLRNVTRLDLALDDYLQRLDITQLWKKWQAKEIVTKIRKARYIESSDWTVEGDLGKTLYIGNPKRMQFRFYDKFQERRAN
jgi:phage replication initiation protein